MTTDPIILVGMQRSGTTWMGRMLGEHPDVAYWPEPRQVWSFGNWFRPDDRLDARHASPLVRRHIRRTFERFTRAQSRSRFAEKTPSNCLRMPFVRAVFPDARILLVVRDGRSIIRSTAQVRTGKKVGWNRLRDRLREARLWDLPDYVMRVPTLIDPVLGRPQRFWGVRPPGWRAWVEHDPPYTVMAKQWAASIRYAIDDGRAMDPERYLEIRYEDLMTRPKEIMGRVVDFFRLQRADELVGKVVAAVDPSREQKWRGELGEDVLAEIRPHIEPTLRFLGYDW
jgi:hypothetical protein